MFTDPREVIFFFLDGFVWSADLVQYFRKLDFSTDFGKYPSAPHQIFIFISYLDVSAERRNSCSSTSLL